MKMLGYEVPENNINGVKVVTSMTISELVGLKQKRVSDIGNRLKTRKFVEGIDYYHVEPDDAHKLNGVDRNFNYARGINAYTESGMQKIIDGCLKYIEKHKDEVEADRIFMDNSQIDDDNAQVENNNASNITMNVPEKLPVQSITDTNTSEIIGLFNRFLDITSRLIDDQIKQNEEMRELVKELTLNQSARQSSVVVSTPVVSVDNDNIEYFIPYPCDFTKWKREINRAVDAICEVSDKTRSEILCECYKALTKEYGYVFDATAREFYAEYHRSPVNSMENVWYGEQTNPSYRNLMIAKLSNMYNDYAYSKEE